MLFVVCPFWFGHWIMHRISIYGISIPFGIYPHFSLARSGHLKTNRPLFVIYQFTCGNENIRAWTHLVNLYVYLLFVDLFLNIADLLLTWRSTTLNEPIQFIYVIC